MASMSYCAIENTATELSQVLNMMKRSEVSNSDYEREAFDRMVELCKDIVSEADGRDFDHFVEIDEDEEDE